jgi:hypothetical protein
MGDAPGKALIVGNGPSVGQIDPTWREALAGGGILLVGVNRVLALEATWNLRFDALLIRDCWRRLWDDPALARRYHGIWQRHSARKLGPAGQRITRCDEFLRFRPGWQIRAARDANGELAVMQAPTAILAAANWAWLQGATRIGLIGVDYAGSYPPRIEPFARHLPDSARQYALPVRPEVESAFAAALRAVRQNGGMIWNLSHQSRLRAIPRIEWTDLLDPAA